jgi:hypothetical protein
MISTILAMKGCNSSFLKLHNHVWCRDKDCLNVICKPEETYVDNLVIDCSKWSTFIDLSNYLRFIILTGFIFALTTYQCRFLIRLSTFTGINLHIKFVITRNFYIILNHLHSLEIKRINLIIMNVELIDITISM